MSDYTWDFRGVFVYYKAFVRGLVGTFTLTGAVLGCGLPCGLVVGVARWARPWYVRWPAMAFIEVFRNIPSLIVLIWFYYACPILIGVQLKAFTAILLAMACNIAAFSAETFRAGLQAIDRGQWEAGLSMGMSFGLLLRRIILPQVIKTILPALTNHVVDVVKITALASTIAYDELLYEGKFLSGFLFRPLEVYTTAALIYFAVVSVGTSTSAWIERAFRQRE